METEKAKRIQVDPDLHSKLKIRAAVVGLTLYDYVNDRLEQALSKEAESGKK